MWGVRGCAIGSAEVGKAICLSAARFEQVLDECPVRHGQIDSAFEHDGWRLKPEELIERHDQFPFASGTGAFVDARLVETRIVLGVIRLYL